MLAASYWEVLDLGRQVAFFFVFFKCIMLMIKLSWIPTYKLFLIFMPKIWCPADKDTDKDTEIIIHTSAER